MNEIIFENDTDIENTIVVPIPTTVENVVVPKKTRGRPKLTDDEKKQRVLERKQQTLEKKLNKPKKPKGRPRVFTDQEREQRKVLTEEQKKERNEYLKNYFSKPENKETHLEYMKKYNIEKKEELKKKRPMYLKNYLNNMIKREVDKIINEKEE